MLFLNLIVKNIVLLYMDDYSIKIYEHKVLGNTINDKVTAI